MLPFVYDGSVPDYPAVWRVVGRAFPTGIPVAVTEAQARKLRCLPYFYQLPAVAADAGSGQAAVVHDSPAEPVVPVKRGRGRPPGSKNKPKVVTDGNEDAR